MHRVMQYSVPQLSLQLHYSLYEHCNKIYFGSLIGGDAGGGMRDAYPACFFEDDEDLPLRRRGRGGRRGRGWKGWFCCGGGGKE